MNPSWKDNVFFILVEPQGPGNIGDDLRNLLADREEAEECCIAGIKEFRNRRVQIGSSKF